MKIIPKSKLYKVKSSLYNIPVNEVYDNSQSIRRPGDSIDLFKQNIVFMCYLNQLDQCLSKDF